MTTDEFVALHPLLFHIADGGSWESIKKFGIESTSALLDRFGVSGQSGMLLNLNGGTGCEP